MKKLQTSFDVQIHWTLTADSQLLRSSVVAGYQAEVTHCQLHIYKDGLGPVHVEEVASRRHGMNLATSKINELVGPV